MKKILIILGALFILIGAVLFSYSLYSDFKYKSEDIQKINDFFEDFNDKLKMPESIYENDKPIEKEKDNTNLSYLGVIEIPKIKLKSGFVLSNNLFTTMDRNISVYPTSKMPNEKGNFILFAHSGNSRVGYFKDIYKLSNNDMIYIYFKAKKYIYKIKETLEVSKSNHIPLAQNQDNFRITLITCKKNDNNKRIVLIGELENVS